MLMIENRFCLVAVPALALNPVVRAVVGNLDKFIEHRVVADLASIKVRLLEAFPILRRPSPDGPLGRQTFIAAANFAKRAALCETLKDRFRDFLRVVRWAAHSEPPKPVLKNEVFARDADAPPNSQEKPAGTTHNNLILYVRFT